MGNSLYTDYFNTAAINLDNNLRKLSAHPLTILFKGDNSVSRSLKGNIETDFATYVDHLLPHLEKAIIDRFYFPNFDDSSKKDDEDMYEPVPENLQYEVDDENKSNDSDLVDVEELGSVMKNSSITKPDDNREMVTPALRRNLQKQGYKILGSHSGVKLCRWTKGMLRGRGGCYKHTFYGISSYQCMEMTPSLACANKCVFCWRHHTNPVGRKWRWKMDEPEFILDEATKNHRQMIKQMKGVPGVRPERYQEAMTIKHCALSLVGEPIMYPKIQKFLNYLHSQNISSFLVTNAQFPEHIRNIGKVTQLYVSVDASTKDNLKAIDRPLFKDF